MIDEGVEIKRGPGRPRKEPLPGMASGTKFYHHRDPITLEDVARYAYSPLPNGTHVFTDMSGKNMHAPQQSYRAALLALEAVILPPRRKPRTMKVAGETFELD